MNIDTGFRERIREFFYYPKLTPEEDKITDARRFTSYLDKPGPADAPTFIYVHVPFCDYLCHFCAFFKTLNQSTSYEDKQGYFNAVSREIALYAESEYFAGRRIKWIEFGGGTPTSVEPEFIEQTLSTLHDKFDLSECEYITSEGDALTLQDRPKLDLMHGYGVNRVSYGVQTFKEVLRKKLGLKPEISDLYAAAQAIREAGIAEFAIDILYNLPDQNVAELDSDLTRAFELAPDYVDTYSLTLWENTWFKEAAEQAKRFAEPPSLEKNVAMFALLLQRMRERDYQALHSYTFATAGPHQYVQNVKDHLLARGDMIGIGPSSRGHIAGHQYLNTSSIPGYVSALESGLLPVDVGRACDEAEEGHRLMVMFPSLLLSMREADIPHPELFAPQIDDLVEHGYLTRENGLLSVTDSGMTWAGNVSRLFFSDAERAKMTRSFLYSKRARVNPYNLDAAGISRRSAARHSGAS